MNANHVLYRCTSKTGRVCAGLVVNDLDRAPVAGAPYLMHLWHKGWFKTTRSMFWRLKSLGWRIEKVEGKP